MSEPDLRLTSIAGEDEWQRQRTLEALRRDGLSDAGIAELGRQLAATDATRRASARMALAALAGPGSASRTTARATLTAALAAEAENIRVLAASTLGEAGDDAAGPALIDALSDPSPNVVAAAADALGELRYGPAVDALGDVGQAGEFWARAAAVVALGRLQDERAIPALDRIAREPGLAEPIAEALGQIDHPSALPVLGRVHDEAPDAALRAAGRLLSTHPQLECPEWVVDGARRNEAALLEELEDGDEPAVARLVGLAGSPEGVERLLDMAGEPRYSEAAVGGLLAVAPDVRADAILDHQSGASDRELVTLLSLLPPLSHEGRIQRLVPLLDHESSAVRGAAAEALARAEVPRALPLLTAALEGGEVAPEVVRAVGSLGDAACSSLMPLLRDPTPAVRAAAASALTRCAVPGLGEELRSALQVEDDPGARDALLLALARAVGGEAMEALEEALASPRLDTRLAAVEALGFAGDESAVPLLEDALERSTAERIVALRALGELRVQAAAAVVEPYLDAPDLDVRRTAARAASLLADSLDPDVVERMARDEDGWIRGTAARLLSRQGEPGRTLLEQLAWEDPDMTVRGIARRELDEGG